MEYEQIVTVFVTLLTVVDPLGLIPIYLPIAEQFPKKEHSKIIGFSTTIAIIISSCFLLAGRALFHTLGIEPYSIYTVGGILLFLIGLDMVYARPRKTRTQKERYEISDSIREVCVFPLAIPMLSGPGTIASLILFASQGNTVEHYLIIFGVLLAVYVICAITMYYSGVLLRIFGRTGINVMDRVMGIILCALAVQFIANSITMFASSLKS
jgi:multiple antibiotic resistance protein